MSHCGLASSPFTPLSLEQSQECIEKSPSSEVAETSFDFGCDLLYEISNAVEDGGELEEIMPRGTASRRDSQCNSEHDQASLQGIQALFPLSSYLDPHESNSNDKVLQLCSQMDELQSTVKIHIHDMESTLHEMVCLCTLAGCFSPSMHPHPMHCLPKLHNCKWAQGWTESGEVCCTRHHWQLKQRSPGLATSSELHYSGYGRNRQGKGCSNHRGQRPCQ